MVLLDVDRDLLQRCLQNSSEAWGVFVERFAGLIGHVVDHEAISRGVALDQPTRDDLISEVFVALLDQDYSILRRFRGGSSLATYLAVVSRRIATRSLKKRRSILRKASVELGEDLSSQSLGVVDLSNLENREQLESVMQALTSEEAVAVRMFHLEGKSYREISIRIGLAENSVGPFLTRAREKLRRKVQQS